jgi:hypothetical protein
MKRIERSRRRVGRRNREEIDGVDEKKRRNGGEDVAAMWWWWCGRVRVWPSNSARESGTPHTKNLRHSTREFLLTPFAIVSYLANNKIIDATSE